MKSVFTLFILIGVTVLSVNAQDPAGDLVRRMAPHPVPASPNAASLDKFGDYKPSYFTGLPEISIQIYEIKSGDLSVPISLSYHASGIRPTDRASWVGANWSLSTGGQITRTIQGQADELDYYAKPAVLNPGTCQTWDYVKGAAMGGTDSEADIFSFMFPSGSGKFTLKSGSPAFLIPQQPFLITPTFVPSGTYAGTFTKFEITDNNGVLYRFGQNAQGTSSTEYTVAVNGGVQTPGTTAWNLLDVVSPNTDNQINYAYQSVGTSDSYDISYSLVINDQCTHTSGSSGNTEPQQDPCPWGTTFTSTTMTSSVNQTGVQSITYKTGKVEFVLGGSRTDVPELKTLDHIDVYSLVNGVYVPQKTIQFIYSYYSTPSGAATGPLKLDAVLFKDNTRPNPILINQYTFKYTSNSLSYNGNLNARDLWGYFNGATENTDLFPPTTVDYIGNSTGEQGTWSFGIGNDRTVHSQYTQEGVLNEIDFPTGGYSKFYYESNKYLDDTKGFPGTPATAGGLRVTKIESYDGIGASPIVKTYKYGENESGFGLANFNIYSFHYSETQYHREQGCTELELNYRIRGYHTNSAFCQDPFDSSPVMYPYVTEYIGDASGANIGKVIYEFDGGSPVRVTPQVVPWSSKNYLDSQNWRKGKMTHKTVYDKAGSKVSETITTYGTYKLSGTSMGCGVFSSIDPINDGVGICGNDLCEPEGTTYTVWQDQFQVTGFSQSSGALLPSSVTEYTYNTGDVTKYVMKQTTNVYDGDKLQLTQTIVTHNTSEEQEVTVNRYPFQFNAISSDAGAAKGIYMLTAKNVLSTPIETYTYLQNTDQTNQRIVSGHITTYRQNEGNTSQAVPDQIYFWESKTPVSKTNYSPAVLAGNSLNMDSNFKRRLQMLNYDESGNVLVASKVNDVSESYLYGYNKTLPIAEVKNAQNNQYQQTTTSESTGISQITIGASGTTTVTQSFPFHVDYNGSVQLKLGTPGGTYSITASYAGVGSGSDVLTSTGCGSKVFSFPNIAPGNYTLTITLTASGGNSVGACGQLEYPQYLTQTNTLGTSEFFLENFEENSLATRDSTQSHTGNAYYHGDYQVNFSLPNSRLYKIEYWYFDNNQWNYISKPYDGTPLALREGSAIDDIRIYPVDARMKSFTYDPLLGMTSEINENGITQWYEYDSFGRLKLIRDNQGKIVKSYSYHYKQQQ